MSIHNYIEMEIEMNEEELIEIGELEVAELRSTRTNVESPKKETLLLPSDHAS